MPSLTLRRGDLDENMHHDHARDLPLGPRSESEVRRASNQASSRHPLDRFGLVHTINVRLEKGGTMIPLPKRPCTPVYALSPLSKVGQKGYLHVLVDRTEPPTSILSNVFRAQGRDSIGADKHVSTISLVLRTFATMSLSAGMVEESRIDVRLQNGLTVAEDDLAAHSSHQPRFSVFAQHASTCRWHSYNELLFDCHVIGRLLLDKM